MALIYFERSTLNLFKRSLNCYFNNNGIQQLSTYKSPHSIKYPPFSQLWCHRTVRFDSTKPPKNPKRKWQIFNWRTVFISGSIVTIFYIGFWYVKREKMIILEKERRRSLGKSAIGGRFDLIDHNGKQCSSNDFLGKWVLIYFGFTHCPDICPDEIEKMIEAVNIIEKTKGTHSIQPVFITVDPERDSPEVVKGYISEFSPKLIGLTGTKEQIDATSKVYRVYYSAGPRDNDNDYIVDHTIIMYLINPSGEFVDYYGQTVPADQMANGIMMAMVKYDKMNKKSFF